MCVRAIVFSHTQRSGISSAVFVFQVVAPLAADGSVTIDVGIFTISTGDAVESGNDDETPLRRGTAAECTSQFVQSCQNSSNRFAAQRAAGRVDRKPSPPVRRH